jgi:hypothetical protein
MFHRFPRNRQGGARDLGRYSEGRAGPFLLGVSGVWGKEKEGRTRQFWQWQIEVRASSGEERVMVYLMSPQ